MAEAKHAGQGQYDIRIEVAEGCEDKYISKTFNSRPRIEDFKPNMEKVEVCQEIRDVYRKKRDRSDEYLAYIRISSQKLNSQPQSESDITSKYPFLIDREQDTGIDYTSLSNKMRYIRASNLLSINAFEKAGGKNKIIELSDKKRLSDLIKMKQ